MRELGASAADEHRAVGALAQQLGIDEVVVVGHGARAIHDALVEERGEDGTTRHVDTVEQAVEWLRDNVAGPDVVLVKASRAGRLERVADALLGDDREPIWERSGPMTTPRNRVWSSLRSPATRFRGDPG